MKVLKIKFGMSGEKIDAYGMRFYGDIDRKAYQFGYISEIISDSDAAPLTNNKRVTLWYIFENLRPYNRVLNYINDLTTVLKKIGYTITVSSLDELVDTTLPEYEGRPEGRFPVFDRMLGYNAARGFSITAENVDAKQEFSIAEIEKIMEFASKSGHAVYGRTLKRADRQS